MNSGGPFLVLDETKDKHLVAGCTSLDAAMMVAAVLNGNPKAAMERRRAVIARLDHHL
jgi:hypothetical protein